ncbi:hypothetical protein ENBRE01_3181 [Enteropsectra breve]|nr:hypothetical protein ENBRE01_3181 [Enteropsectra breve]
MEMLKDFKVKEVRKNGKKTYVIGSINGESALLTLDAFKNFGDDFDWLDLNELQISKNDVYNTFSFEQNLDIVYTLKCPVETHELASLRKKYKYAKADAEAHGALAQPKAAQVQGSLFYKGEEHYPYADTILSENDSFLLITDVSAQGCKSSFKWILFCKKYPKMSISDIRSVDDMNEVKAYISDVLQKYNVPYGDVCVYAHIDLSSSYLYFSIVKISFTLVNIKVDGWYYLLDDIIKNLQLTQDYYAQNNFIISETETINKKQSLD